MPEPAISSQPSPKLMSISADGSVNGKNDGRKRTFRSSRSKKRRRNSVSTPLRSANADVVVDPQALDLVEHRRVRRVGVDAVDAPGRDDLDRRPVRLHVADLDRRGVRAQQVAARRRRRCRASTRAGWFSGVLSAVKLWKSSSISGPSATSKPSERNSVSMRSSVRVTGCRPPVPRAAARAAMTSSASAASCASSARVGQRVAARGERRFERAPWPR